MVSKKSIYYGPFDGFQVPLVPKAARSMRKSSHKKSSEGSKLCAFDLLADVADKLLQESESSTSSTGQEVKEAKTVPIVNQEEPEVKAKPSKESPKSDSESGLEHVSINTCDFLKKVGSNVKLKPSEEKNVDNLEAVVKQSGDMTFSDPIVNSHVIDKSYSSVDLSFYKNHVSCYTRYRGNVKMGITNNNKMRAFRSQSRVGYRRIRRTLNSRYRKVIPVKDYELTNPTSGLKSIYQKGKNIKKPERCQRESASKRRKLFHHNSSNTTTYFQEASNNVKFCIDSFEVPELYIEMPEMTTIGSLKRTVMEAVRDILGGELQVGILLEGKKVKDNNQTLKQTGISQSCDLKTLGFTLEPSSCTASPITDVGCSNCSLDPSATDSLDNHVDKNQEIVCLETEVLTEEKVTDSKAVVNVKHKQSKNFEVSQHNRRIRRPFSVSEVEALVEAVEMLGTGRWRDVKLRAFDDASHRTYVDLKDKWKTLVHTASISPQQRRGEPVPQDLLDRVLAAHGYWLNHQFKQQRKHQTEPLRILDGSSVEFVGI